MAKSFSQISFTHLRSPQSKTFPFAFRKLETEIGKNGYLPSARAGEKTRQTFLEICRKHIFYRLSPPQKGSGLCYLLFHGSPTGASKTRTSSALPGAKVEELFISEHREAKLLAKQSLLAWPPCSSLCNEAHVFSREQLSLMGGVPVQRV